jgi:hypothetical protein
VFLKNAVTGGDPVEIGSTDQTQYTVTLNTEGKFFVCVSAILSDADGNVLGESAINCTDDPANCANGEDFGIQFFISSDGVKNFRIVGG